MNICFLGLCDFGLEYLKHLISLDDVHITFVTSKASALPHISQSEKECLKLCEENNIEYLGNVNVNDKAIVSKAQQNDICIVGGYDKIIKQPFINALKQGVYNTHLGLIPRHRGCYPVIWAILYDDYAGFSTYQVTEDIDLGDIVTQEKLSIQPNETCKDLYSRLSHKAIEVFPDTWNKISNNTAPLKSLELTTIYHKVGMPNDRWISWEWRGEMISRLSRALDFPPYLGPRTKLGDTEIALKVRKFAVEPTHHTPGEIIAIADKDITIATSDGICQCAVETNITLTLGEQLTSMQGDIHPIAIDYNKERLLS